MPVCVNESHLILLLFKPAIIFSSIKINKNQFNAAMWTNEQYGLTNQTYLILVFSFTIFKDLPDIGTYKVHVITFNHISGTTLTYIFVVFHSKIVSYIYFFMLLNFKHTWYKIQQNTEV